MEKFFKFFLNFCLNIKTIIFLIILLIVNFILEKFGFSFLFDINILIVIVAGFPIFYNALESVLKKEITSSLLITFAVIGAIFIRENFAAAEIVIIMAIGEILENITVKKAKKAIENLIEISPKYALKIIDNQEVSVDVNDIEVDDILKVVAGEQIPVDGIVVEGEGLIDQSIMTGESLPVKKKIGDSVFSATINTYGYMLIKAMKTSKDSSLNKMIQLVEEAENTKAPLQKTIDKWAKIIVPMSLTIAFVSFFINLFLGLQHYEALKRSVTVLVVFCPCALVLATPTSIMASIGQATKKGIIIKGGQAIENFAKANKICFDKTGTITKGEISLSEIKYFGQSIDEKKFMTLISSLESYSKHPLAISICKKAKDLGIVHEEVSDFNSVDGKGLKGKCLDSEIFIGNEKFLMDNGYELAQKIIEKIKGYQIIGKLTCLVGIDKKSIAILVFSDEIKEGVLDIMREFKKLNLETVLLSGDSNSSVEYISHSLGIEKFYGQLLPKDKLDYINNFSKDGVVCMIGDGVNDAPALKMADVSIAMAKVGSDIAIETSDISLMSDDIEKLIYLKKLSNVTLKTIKVNIIFAMTVNVIALFLSLFGFMNPVIGALVHNLGSVLVVINAAMLYEKKI